MRLLNVDKLELSDFLPVQIPRYAILSHRWGSQECTFQDVKRKHNDDVRKEGYKKLESFAKHVKKSVPHIEWIWMDTCCINKENAAELSEAINSMYKWYSEAEVCFAYLAGTTRSEDLEEFKGDEWFRRGWTFQELVASVTVVFLTRTWEVIGHKGKTGRCRSGTDLESGLVLTSSLAAVTGIPKGVLDDFQQSKNFTVEERLAWVDGRQTSREEDMSYCLLGIFGVNMPAIYGEGSENARARLLEAIQRLSETFMQNYQSTRLTIKDSDESRKIVHWLSAPDPQTNHASARLKHEPGTGMWLLKSDQYRRWRQSLSDHLWLSGKAGCGKTVLCSSVVEDVKQYCEATTNIVHATFYFSFSEALKQSYEGFLRSLVVQLACVGPSLSRLRQAYDNPKGSVPVPYELEEILVLAARSYHKVFLLLDALDECPESDTGSNGRQDVLNFLGRFAVRASNVKIFTTSREAPDIDKSMHLLHADRIVAAGRLVDSDIRDYVSTQMSRNARLDRLNPALKTEVADTFAQKADGMFRWAFCQLEELKKLKLTKPSYVREALNDLPQTLDETYERMLEGIDKYRDEALVLLNWLAYARSPPSLGELTETIVIDLNKDSVEIGDRGSPEDILDILAGLVTIDRENEDEYMDSKRYEASDVWNEVYIDRTTPQDFCKPTDGTTKVRLAHYSVKEYLESGRIARCKVKQFHLDAATGHRLLAQSCIAYIMHYSTSLEKKSTREDLATFPMLEYAAQTWPFHSSRQQRGDVSREIALLCSESARHDWLLVHPPDWRSTPFESYWDGGSALYYASFSGLDVVVEELLRSKVDVNSQGGHYGSALCGASWGGHEKVVKLLIDGGADINAQGWECGSALCAASRGGHEKTVKILLDRGADVNAWGGFWSSPLYEASRGGHEKIVKILIDGGADVNAQGGPYGSALCAALVGGHGKIVKILIDCGADVNAQGKVRQRAGCGINSTSRRHGKIAD